MGENMEDSNEDVDIEIVDKPTEDAPAEQSDFESNSASQGTGTGTADASPESDVNVRKSHRSSSGSSSSRERLTRSKDSPTSSFKSKGLNMAINSSGSLKRSLDHESAVNVIKLNRADEPQSEAAMHPPPVKRQKVDKSGEKMGAVCDPYCWVCHKEGTTLDCEVCPRSYHNRCAGQGTVQDPSCWSCPECQCIIVAEDTDTQSPAMSLLTVDQLVALFKFSLQRLKNHALEAFHKPVSQEEVPTYTDYIVHPMDLSTLEKNIKLKMYGCTESLLADVKWIYHNSYVFNGNAHKLTSSAKSLLTTCKQEMREIEVCPDCYLHAYTVKENWFVEPCRRPHTLVWAKLKGFPFWPGKAMRVVNGSVDIRFFGAHDRAWVPLNLCYQLSSEMPAPLKTKKKTSFENSLEELEIHISKLRLKLGGFEYAPVRTPLDTEKLYLCPMSKVTTGRRHSDAEQASPIKGRTVTIVTSSWMRKIQAEEANAAAAAATAATATSVSKASPTKKKRKGAKHKTVSPKSESKIQGSKASPTPKTPVASDTNPEPRPSSVKVSDVNKNPPRGVFETSNNFDIPKELNLQTETIVLNDFSASHLEKLKQLESTIERIKETIDNDEEDDEQDQNREKDDAVDPEANDKTSSVEPSQSDERSAPSDIGRSDLPSPEMEQSSSSDDASRGDNKSPECEVSSMTNSESIAKSPDVTSNLSSFAVPKKGSAFVMKLDQMIESCKANLGIDEVVPPNETSSSDSDQEESSAGSNDDREKQNATDGHEEAASDEGEQDSTGSKKDESSAVSSQVDDSQPVAIDVDPPSQNSHNEEEEIMEVSPMREKELESDSDVEVIENECEDKLPDRETPPTRPTSNQKDSDLVIKDNTQDKKPKVVNDDEHPPSEKSSRLSSNHDLTPATLPDITKYAYKVMEIMSDLCKDVGTPENSLRALELEIERINWLHEQEIREIKHNTDLVLLEVRGCMEADKKKALAEQKRKYEIERNKLLLENKKAVDEVKKKQWCANCKKEAIYYCCWNTSYCDYQCQQDHWPSHMTSCAQTQRTSIVADAQTDSIRPNSNVVIAQYQTNSARARPRLDQNCLVRGDGVRMAYEPHMDPRHRNSFRAPHPMSQMLPPPMLNPPFTSHFPSPVTNAQILPQTTSVGNNASVSVHYVSSLPGNLSNYQLIPQNIPLPRITGARLPQASSIPSPGQPRLTRPPSQLVSRPSLMTMQGNPARFSPHSQT